MRYLIILSLNALFLWSCSSDKKEKITTSTLQDLNLEKDSASFVQIYLHIFSESCALNGCHDGSFEPDFSTIASTYSTLVYHPIVKNNKDSSYRYRVVPYDTASSVLYARISQCCFVNQDDRMPQHTIGEALPEIQIERIALWILAGAPDACGKACDTTIHRNLD